MLLRCITIVIFMLLISSCSLFSPVKNDATQYRLDAIPKHLPKKHKHAAVVLISLPETQKMYDTTGMAYTIQPHQIAYFSKNEWVESPSQMIHPLIVRTLQQTNYFKAVLPSLSGQYDYILTTQILQLQQNFMVRPAQLQLVMNVQLIRANTNRVIASQLITIHQTMHTQNPYGGVLAANLAMEKALRDIAQFALKHAR